MSQWNQVLTPQELKSFHAFTATLDPAFASREEAFYKSRTKAQLESLAHSAWMCNEPTGYQLACSYAAIAE